MLESGSFQNKIAPSGWTAICFPIRGGRGTGSTLGSYWGRRTKHFRDVIKKKKKISGPRAMGNIWVPIIFIR